MPPAVACESSVTNSFSFAVYVGGYGFWNKMEEYILLSTTCEGTKSTLVFRRQKDYKWKHEDGLLAKLRALGFHLILNTSQGWSDAAKLKPR